jgi:hypothetical protein
MTINNDIYLERIERHERRLKKQQQKKEQERDLIHPDTMVRVREVRK